MTDIGRNAPCPCRSGLKYKRCCLRRKDEVALDAAAAERVWDRMQSWALRRFGDELGASLKEHMDTRGVGGDERPATEDDLSLALCWLLIDREVAPGCTPARLYSELPELASADREMAVRIAASRLGLYRVREVDPGAGIELENVLDGARTRVASPNVSREAVRWHVLLCRVMKGGPTPSLWGAAGFYQPAEEVELLAELRRTAAVQNVGDGVAGLEAALRVGAGELVCFVPPSRCAERVPYTLEGDLVAMAEATWRLHEPGAAFDALRDAPDLAFDGETEDGEGVAFDWLTSRRGLLARRPALPVGAICMEGGPVQVGEDAELECEDVTSLGTFTLRGDRLEYFGLSEARLAAAIALVERCLGHIAGRPRRRARSVDEALAATRAERGAPPVSPVRPGAPPREERAAAPDARIRELAYRRWIDDPNERLGGLSPREAVARGEHLEEVGRQLRSLEHHSARERADRLPGPGLVWLRAELGLDAELLAA
jgi:hypothetical protein